MLGHGSGIGYTGPCPRMGPVDNFSLFTGSHSTMNAFRYHLSLMFCTKFSETQQSDTKSNDKSYRKKSADMFGRQRYCQTCSNTSRFIGGNPALWLVGDYFKFYLSSRPFRVKCDNNLSCLYISKQKPNFTKLGMVRLVPFWHHYNLFVSDVVSPLRTLNIGAKRIPKILIPTTP